MSDRSSHLTKAGRFSIRGIGRLLGDSAGSTAVEFGMLAFPLIGLMGATIDAGMLYFRSAQLQMTTESASRNILTKSLSSQLTYQQFLDQYVCTWQSAGSVRTGTLGKMFDCSKLIVDIQTPTSWTGADKDNDFTAAQKSGRIPLPLAGQIAVIRIVYPVNQFFGFLGKSRSSLAGRSSNVVMGVSAFRVEP